MQGVRACTSRMRDELYEVMEERMKAFNEDHPIEMKNEELRMKN